MTDTSKDLGLPRQQIHNYIWNSRVYADYFIELMGEISSSLFTKTTAQAHYFGWPGYAINEAKIDDYLSSDCGNVMMFTQDYINDELAEQYYNFFKTRWYYKFILFTGMYNFNIDLPNVRVISWGGDILMQNKEYQSIEPVRIKNFSNGSWISLSNIARPARILAATFLLGLKLEGRIRLGITNLDKWRDEIELPDKFIDLVDHGLSLLKNKKYYLVSNNPYGNRIFNDNAGNFDDELRKWYTNSAVEIVNETLFFSKNIFITEKFRNSVWGFNLPIILSSPGTVAHLRELGFDMFDDIIDHSYDLIENDVERMHQAITNNIRLLNDPEYAQQQWRLAYDRLESNYVFARDHMGNVYKQRTIDLFNKIYPDFYVLNPLTSLNYNG